MLDNALINLIASQLESASAAAGWHYPVVQKNDPGLEGISSTPTIFFEKISDHHYGFQMVQGAYNSVTTLYSDTETQNIETTFQISALVPQDPTNLSLPTASDVVNYLKMYLQSSNIIATLMAQSVNMLRVSNIRNPYFIDDRDRFEANPNFDLVVVHSNTISLTTNSTNIIVGAPSLIPGDPTVGVFIVEDSGGAAFP